jgi:hypothetical protein
MATLKYSIDRPVVWMRSFLGSDFLTAPKRMTMETKKNGATSLPIPKLSCKS